MELLFTLVLVGIFLKIVGLGKAADALIAGPWKFFWAVFVGFLGVFARAIQRLIADLYCYCQTTWPHQTARVTMVALGVLGVFGLIVLLTIIF